MQLGWMARLFCWSRRRWMRMVVAVLSLPLTAVPSQAQATPTVTLPRDPTDASPTAQISTQAADLLPLAIEQPPAWEDFELGVESSPGATSLTLSGGSLTPSGESLAPALPNVGFAGRDPEAISSTKSVLAQQEGGESGSNPDFLPAADPNAGLRIPRNLAEGLPIQQVFVHLGNPTRDADRDEALRQQLASNFRIRAGGTFSPLFADRALHEVRQLPFVEFADYRVYESNLPGSVIVALLVTLRPESAEDPKAPPEAQQPSGILVSGSLEDFPTLYRSDRALAKFILNGGIGVFSDTEPWFGNADDFATGPYQPTGTITWGEAYLEPGLAGIVQLGDSPLYLYGAATYTLSATVQPDIFRTDDRLWGDIEQLYGGLLVARPDGRASFNLSAGRQNFQLDRGFLFSQFAGSAKALDRAASYSNPRTAYERTLLANLHWGDVRWQGFFLQPDELPVADSETQYVGTSLSFNNNQNLEAAPTYVAIAQSDRLSVLPDGQTFSREGSQTINPRLRLSSLFGISGLWAEGEYAYQFSDRRRVAAQGGYVWLGYTAEEIPWRPSIRYCFAGFSGDNPNTSAYERFDPLYRPGFWVSRKGLNFV